MEKMIREPLDVAESSLKHVSILGRGSFGSVSLKRDSNFRLYAKKSSSFDHLKNLAKELRIMLCVRNHPRIVQASSSVIHLGIKPEGCHIYMVFASKGTLFNMISEFRGKPMPENMIGRAAFMILQGLDALHSHRHTATFTATSSQPTSSSSLPPLLESHGISSLLISAVALRDGCNAKHNLKKSLVTGDISLGSLHV